MANSIKSRRYRTMTVEQAQAAAPLPIDGDPPHYVVKRVRILDRPSFESIGETPDGEPIFVPIAYCEIHGVCMTCECQAQMSRN